MKKSFLAFLMLAFVSVLIPQESSAVTIPQSEIEYVADLPNAEFSVTENQNINIIDSSYLEDPGLTIESVSDSVYSINVITSEFENDHQTFATYLTSSISEAKFKDQNYSTSTGFKSSINSPPKRGIK